VKDSGEGQGKAECALVSQLLSMHEVGNQPDHHSYSASQVRHDALRQAVLLLLVTLPYLQTLKCLRFLRHRMRLVRKEYRT
jgi:hypothetical protein